MRLSWRILPVLGAITLSMALLSPGQLAAQSGTWSYSFPGGSWSNPGNWVDGNIASGTDATADFSTLALTADNAADLDTSFTVGNLIFGDATVPPASNWTLDNLGIAENVLTLATSTGTPSITVNNKTATITAVLDGTQGLSATGAGTLVLSGANTYSGGTTIPSGMHVVAANTSALGTGSVTLSGGTLKITAQGNDLNLSGFGGSGTGWTVNSDNISTAPFPSANVLQLTDNHANQARSAYYNTPVPIANDTRLGSPPTIYILPREAKRAKGSPSSLAPTAAGRLRWTASPAGWATDSATAPAMDWLAERHQVSRSLST